MDGPLAALEASAALLSDPVGPAGDIPPGAARAAKLEPGVRPPCVALRVTAAQPAAPLLFDLEELELDRRLPLFGYNRFSLFSSGPRSRPLRWLAAARGSTRSWPGDRPAGRRVQVLCMPACWAIPSTRSASGSATARTRRWRPRSTVHNSATGIPGSVSAGEAGPWCCTTSAVAVTAATPRLEPARDPLSGRRPPDRHPLRAPDRVEPGYAGAGIFQGAAGPLKVMGIHWRRYLFPARRRSFTGLSLLRQWSRSGGVEPGVISVRFFGCSCAFCPVSGLSGCHA